MRYLTNLSSRDASIALGRRVNRPEFEGSLARRRIGRGVGVAYIARGREGKGAPAGSKVRASGSVLQRRRRAAPRLLASCIKRGETRGGPKAYNRARRYRFRERLISSRIC